MSMPSTTFSFFINPGLFVKTRSRILLNWESNITALVLTIELYLPSQLLGLVLASLGKLGREWTCHLVMFQHAKLLCCTRERVHSVYECYVSPYFNRNQNTSLYSNCPNS